MKTLLLVRHAKSSWDNFSLKDEDRPLNDRGKKNAPEMAKRLRKGKIEIETILTSPAKRAKATAEFFAEEYGIKKNKLIVVPGLYMANRDGFIAAIRNAPQNTAHLAVFSHNNGITEFANLLSETRVDHMPTCSVFAVRCAINSWAEFEVGNNEFYFFDYPKSVS
jgi:phosphohistidine phosphatase